MADPIEAQRFETKMTKDFAPDRLAAGTDQRVAAALEYLAFQAGQINRKLDALTEAIKRLVSDDPVGPLG
jgi:hypothetical protein